MVWETLRKEEIDAKIQADRTALHLLQEALTKQNERIEVLEEQQMYLTDQVQVLFGRLHEVKQTYIKPYIVDVPPETAIELDADTVT